MNSVEKKIVAFARPYMEGHHDFGHYKRVEQFARLIWEKEGGDWKIIFTAIWLHDIGRKESVSNHPTVGARLAKEFLSLIGFPNGEMDAVVRAILKHDEHGGQQTIEEKIVYDADRLDCFNYSGLVRCLCEPYVTGMASSIEGAVKWADDYLKVAFRHINTKTARQVALGYKREFLDNFLEGVKSEQTL